MPSAVGWKPLADVQRELGSLANWFRSAFVTHSTSVVRCPITVMTLLQRPRRIWAPALAADGVEAADGGAVCPEVLFVLDAGGEQAASAKTTDVNRIARMTISPP